MLPPFDIFRVGDDEIPLWVETVETLEDAKARIKEPELAKSSSAKEYLIFSQQTQNRISIKPHDS
jgi:hypothetical protein